MPETTVWIDADGNSTTLSVEWSAKGRGMPKPRFDEQQVPEEPGLRMMFVDHMAREFVLPLWITGTTESDLLTNLRALIRSMDPTRGEGIIRVTTVIGDTRELGCRYIDGLDLDESLGSTSGPLVQRCPVMFRAYSPYWRDPSDTSVEWSTGSSPSSGWFPFDGFPVLSSSEIFSDASVNNSGDVATWPVWNITGPATDLILRNVTTGKYMDLDYTIGSGEQIVIDTRPGVKTIGTVDGGNLMPYLTSFSAFWRLERGSNTVRVEANNTSATTLIQMSRRHLYLSV